MDHYERLKVNRDAPLEVIRAAYRALAAKQHPDRHGQSEGANSDMALLNAAYEVLSDPLRRAEYDTGLQEESIKAQTRTDTRARRAERTASSASSADFSSVGSAFDPDAAAAPVDAFNDIDWAGLKAPPATNPWLSKSRLVPLGLLASAGVVAVAAWLINDMTRQMDAERTLSAHLGTSGAQVAIPPSASDPEVAVALAKASGKSLADTLPDADSFQPVPLPSTAASAVDPAPVLTALTPARRHMLDGEPVDLKLDTRPNAALSMKLSGQ